MAKVAIMTDSNSGITQVQGNELGIKVVPMPFTIDGEEFFEDINLTQEDFYHKLTNDANVSTSQPAIGFVMSIWDELLKDHDQVIYIPMSSELSQSYMTAAIAAKEGYEGKVFVINNRRISVTQRQSVLDAIELANKGYSGEDIEKILMEQSLNCDIYIMVDTLKYLKKGGRITPAAAAVGGLLKIKPVLRIYGSKLDKHRMMNRTVENAKRILIDSCAESINTFLKELDGKTDNVHLEVAYTGIDKTQINDLMEQIKLKFPNQEIHCDPLSLSVACHIGTGAIAMAVSKKLILK